MTESIYRLSILGISNFVGKLILGLKDAFHSLFFEKRFFSQTFIENLREIVWSSLPIATLTVGSSAIVSSIHSAPAFGERGLSIYLGGMVALGLIREGVPVMGSLAVISRYCSGVTSQICSMKVTDQLDAMKIAKVQPHSYFLLPMLFAGFIGFPIIVLICIIFGLAVNFLTTNLLINISYNIYTTSIFNKIELKDIFLAIIKASIFGFFVTLVSYNCGVQTKGGSKAVGSATRLSVVINFAGVIILDYIITALWL